MNGFTYHNIFATKGIEYLAIITFFIVLVPFWMLLNRKRKASNDLQSTTDPNEIQKHPNGLVFSRQHTWAFLHKSGFARIGLNAMLIKLLGSFEIMYHKEAGETVTKGEQIASLLVGDHKLSIHAPITGKILKTNILVQNSSDIVQLNPYEKGWLVEVEPYSWITEISNFTMADEAHLWVKSEWSKFKDFVTFHSYNSLEPSMLRVMQDGGELAENPLKEMPESVWNEFQKEFLQPNPNS
jgi:glycine cleavage system H protein